MENLKPIPGYEGLYSITEDGIVWRDARPRKSKYYSIKGGYWMKCACNRRGYLWVGLTKEKKRALISIHRLVASAYISNPNNKPQINHIDGDKNNNHFSNLEWVTANENNQHAWDTGLNKSTEKHKAAARMNIKIATAAKLKILNPGKRP